MPAASDRGRKVRDIYTFISEHLYLGRSDLDLQGEYVNSTLLLSLLTALIGGKALIHWRARPWQNHGCRIRLCVGLWGATCRDLE